jgi:hypothetical protein
VFSSAQNTEEEKSVQAATGYVESCIVKDNVIAIMKKGRVNVAFILMQRLKGKIKPVLN